MRKINISSVFGLLLLITIYSSIAAGCLQAQQNDEPWITFTPEQSVSNGLHVVLISGDEEYRSEEALPMLAKILTTHHGFKTTVLFSTDPETGEINPDNQNHIVGMENLQSADLAIIFLRFRELPDSEMRYFDEFLKAGSRSSDCEPPLTLLPIRKIRKVPMRNTAGITTSQAGRAVLAGRFWGRPGWTITGTTEQKEPEAWWTESWSE